MKLILAPFAFLITISLFAGAAAPRVAYAADYDSPFQLAQQTLTAVATGNINLSSAASAIASHALVTKAYLLDPAAWIASQLSLQAVIKGTLNWAASGFDGAPSFVTDLNKRLQTVGDTAALGFIDQLRTNNSINSPFQDTVAQAVRSTYLRSSGNTGFFDSNSFTLDKVSSNPSAFLKGDFSQGGFNAFFAANEPQNNPIGAYQLALQATNKAAENSKDSEKTQLSWASGVKAYKGKCTAQKTGSSTALSLNSVDPCLFSTIITPGSQILAATNKATGASIDKLVSAKSLDEVASSFLTNILLNALKHGVGNASNNSDTTSTGVAAGAAASTDTTSAIASIVANQAEQITAYQQSWQTIKSAATAAQSCSDPRVQSTLDRANVALGKGASALSALNKIAGDITAAGQLAPGTEASAFQNIVDEYSTLFSSGTLPDQTEITEAATQSATTSADGTPTLLMQMQTLSTSCGSGQ